MSGIRVLVAGASIAGPALARGAHTVDADGNVLAGELAAAGWDPAAGFAGYEERMRSFVEANQEIGRLHVRSLIGPGPNAELDAEWFPELIERAINGVDLPDYAGVPDSGASARPPITSSAAPLGPA